MKIGLCGAHRVGKTTLAKAFADASGMRFVETRVSSILESIGLNPKVQYSFEQRLEAQILILKKLKVHWEAYISCIMDRTPIDVLAYMEADVLRNFPNNKEIETLYMEYRKDCLDWACRFDKIILIQPGIPIVEDDTSAPGVLPYMEHLNSLMFGYVADLSLSGKLNASVLERDVLDLNQRVDFIKLCTQQ